MEVNKAWIEKNNNFSRSNYNSRDKINEVEDV